MVTTILKARAELLAKIRSFFAERNVLEVETPLFGKSTIPSPNIHSFKIKDFYLQTSPEFAMKRLLAMGSGDIYQICKAFRDEECGRLHSSEFTILEWYRVGFDHHQLMNEMDTFFSHILPTTQPAERMTYATAFERYLAVNPHQCSLQDLQKLAKNNHLDVMLGEMTSDFDIWLELLFVNFVEPNLGIDHPTFIYDFPASQAALAKIRQDKYLVAERFEVYLHGIELANGFHELTDPIVQRQRFADENKQRKIYNLPLIPLDKEFLTALAKLPACSGVALGLDRLLLIMTKANSLQEIIFGYS
jgi:elongation factor P--(R)-beta-lysine ligase